MPQKSDSPGEIRRPKAGPGEGRRGKSRGMREVLRQEKKYLMTLLDGQRLCARLSGFLLEDAHSGAQGYAVRSLYFDTLDDGDYQDKMEGLELRRKLRLRIYDPAAGFAMLEMKQKEGAYQKKRSLRLDREAAERLIRGDFRPLLDCGGSFAAERSLPRRTRSASPWTAGSPPRRPAGTSSPPAWSSIRCWIPSTRCWR